MADERNRGIASVDVGLPNTNRPSLSLVRLFKFILVAMSEMGGQTARLVCILKLSKAGSMLRRVAYS